MFFLAILILIVAGIGAAVYFYFSTGSEKLSREELRQQDGLMIDYTSAEMSVTIDERLIAEYKVMRANPLRFASPARNNVDVLVFDKLKQSLPQTYTELISENTSALNKHRKELEAIKQKIITRWGKTPEELKEGFFSRFPESRGEGKRIADEAIREIREAERQTINAGRR